MKSAHDPRHLRRRKAVQDLFSMGFLPQEGADEFAKIVFEKKEELDEFILKAAPQWPIEKLNQVDLAILRLATHELKHTEIPSKVIIDEAVELAKEFGGENSPSFVNGVLGNILTQLGKTTEEKKETQNSNEPNTSEN